MALISILLSVVALLCTAVGFFTTPIPVVGTLFSFGAAAIAIAGVVVGGRAVTAAKQQGRPNDTARIGVVLNALALVPALLVALTCGLCNALFSSGNMQVQRDFQWNVGRGWPGGPDAGPNALPPPQRAAPQDSNEPPPEGTPAAPSEPGQPSQQGSQPGQPANPSAPPQQPGQQGASPSQNLPPPPLPAGPGK